MAQTAYWVLVWALALALGGGKATSADFSSGTVHGAGAQESVDVGNEVDPNG